MGCFEQVVEQVHFYLRTAENKRRSDSESGLADSLSIEAKNQKSISI
jgi:hypothetical protein